MTTDKKRDCSEAVIEDPISIFSGGANVYLSLDFH